MPVLVCLPYVFSWDRCPTCLIVLPLLITFPSNHYPLLRILSSDICPIKNFRKKIVFYSRSGNIIFYSERQAEYMELSETERLMLVKKKEEIAQITDEILDIYTKRGSRKEVIKKMNHVLSILSTIESYAKPDRNLSPLTRLVIAISHNPFVPIDYPNYINAHEIPDYIPECFPDTYVIIFCTAVNSIKFDFTKKRMKLADSIILNIENSIAKLEANLIKK